MKLSSRGQDAVNADGYNLPFLRRLLCCRLRSGTGTRIKLHRNFIPSFLRRRRDSNRIFLVVLADCATNFGIQSHAGSFSASARRFVCAAITGSKMLSRFSLVAGCDNCFHHRLSATATATAGINFRWHRSPPHLQVPLARLLIRKFLRESSRSTLSILLVSSFVILAFWYVRPFYQSSGRNFAMPV